MIPAPPFRYLRPESLAEAIALLAEIEGALPLAGGTDLVTMRAMGAIAPAALVDLAGLPLAGVEIAGGEATIGACTTLDAAGRLRAAALGALADGARVVGGPQTRNRATVGGNVCRSSPAGDTLPGLLALGADVVLVGPDGERRLPVDAFFTGPGQNRRRRDELLVAVHIADLSGASAYERFTPRASLDLAVVGVAARIVVEDGVCRDVVIALGGVAPTPVTVVGVRELLVGEVPNGSVLAAVAAAAVACADPIDDVRDTREHRLRLVEALVPRVVRRALERAAGETR